MAKRDLSALMGNSKKPEQQQKKGGKKTTIVFDADDEAEIRRIEDELRAKGAAGHRGHQDRPPCPAAGPEQRDGRPDLGSL